MEDSGREKLQGQASAELSDAKASEALNFDSASIDKKQKEHFSNIEGVEEKKKAAAKAAERAARAEQKARDNEIRQAIKDEKPIRRNKRGLYMTAALIAVALLTLFGLVYFGVISIPGLSRKQDKQPDEEYALQLLDQAIARSGFEEAESDYAMGLEIFEEAEQATSDETRLAYIYVVKADYAGNYFGQSRYARTLLNDEIVQNNTELVTSCFYQKIDYDISMIEGNVDRINEIEGGDCLNYE
jgi:hypothetical protein